MAETMSEEFTFARSDRDVLSAYAQQDSSSSISELDLSSEVVIPF